MLVNELRQFHRNANRVDVLNLTFAYSETNLFFQFRFLHLHELKRRRDEIQEMVARADGC